MNQMNMDQSDAVHHLTGPCIVVAPPGSGKTFVLTNRIQYLTECAGVAPESILVITFTKAAAVQMKERYLSLTEQVRTKVTFGTFHAVYFAILKTSFHYRADAVLTEREKRTLLCRIMESFSLEEEELPDPERFLEELSRMKNAGGSIADYESPEQELSFMDRRMFCRIGRRYEAACRNQGKVDFDDMVLLCREALLKNREILEEWQKRFRYILIDEFQDINPMQYEVIRMLAAPENNLFAVGDDDQSVYGFRGSDPSIMLSLEKDYPEIRKIALRINYRSDRKILHMADRLIRHNLLRYPKELSACSEQEGSARIATLRTADEQDACIVQAIRTWGAFSDTAVIVRTNASLSRYAALLTTEGIPFCLKEKIRNPFEHVTVQDVCAYLRVADAAGTRSDFFRIMNKPQRYLSRNALYESLSSDSGDFMNALSRYYAGKTEMQKRLNKLSKDLERIASMTPYAAVNYIRKGTGYEAALKEGKIKGADAKEALKILDLLQTNAKRYDSRRAFLTWVEEQRRAYPEPESRTTAYPEQKDRKAKPEYADRAAGAEPKPKGVTLITMHGAKGLEYRNVILPDLNEKNMPHKKAFLPEEIEEERRIFYVAITRAKENLLITCVQKDGDEKNEESRFLKEIRTNDRKKDL